MREIGQIAKDISAMDPAQRLELAAQFLREATKHRPGPKRTAALNMAHSIADKVVTELGAVLVVDAIGEGRHAPNQR